MNWSQLKSSVICLVPLKDLKNAKTRLRKNLPKSHSKLIFNLYEHTLEVVKVVCDFGVVSPDPNLLNWAKTKGAIFTHKDQGLDLNKSLEDSISVIKTTGKWKFVCILMSDLPLLNPDQLLQYLKDPEIVSRPSILPVCFENNNNSEEGTSGLYFSLNMWSRISLQFGVRSFIRFKDMFNQKKLPFNVHYSIIGRDLDLMDDFKYLDNYKNDLRFVSKLYALIS